MREYLSEKPGKEIIVLYYGFAKKFKKTKFSYIKFKKKLK